MEHNRLKLNDIFPNWKNDSAPTLAGGFFRRLYEYLIEDEIVCPWLPSEDIAKVLDLEYHGNRSGQKRIAPFPRNMLSGDFQTGEVYLSELAAKQIAQSFYIVFGANINKQYSTMFLKYNPIENYNMIEESEDSESGTDTTTKTGTETTTNVGKTVTERENTRGLYGYDSSSPVNADKTNDTFTQTVGADNSPMTETRAPNLTDETERENTHSHTLTRSGNIGVTTSQQMLQSERDLWVWNFYRDFVFPCVDSILTLPIY